MRNRAIPMKKRLAPMAVCLLVCIRAVYANSTLLDSFEDLEGWTVATPDGVALEIAQDEGHTGLGMRLDFDFHGGGGYLVARKVISVPLPANYAFSFHVRGEAPENDLEFKLLDPSEKEVWWAKRREFSFPTEWQKITVKKRHLEFGWGPPPGGKELAEVAVVEIAIAAGMGGKGSVWIDNLSFEERPVNEYNASPLVRASTTANGYEPATIFDGDASTSWMSGSIAEGQWLLIDFQQNREYGGLIIDWQQDDYAEAYEVQISDDGKNWQRVYSVDASNGGRDYVYLPDLESRFVRLDLQRSSRGRGYGITAIEIKPYEFSSSPNNLFAAIAEDSARGAYPRYLIGEQSHWTVVGVSGDKKEALLNQDGLLEIDKERFSIEPFVYTHDGLISWNDVSLTHTLEDDYLPIPSVIWEHSGLKLKITALAAGEAGSSSLYARYRIENHTNQRQQGSLFLALRPFQVNPPWQSLNTDGGAVPIREMFYDNDTVVVDNEKALTSLTVAERFGAVTFAQGGIVEYLRKGNLPVQTAVADSFGYASGALEYSFDLLPGDTKAYYVTVPFYQTRPLGDVNLSDEEAHQTWQAAFETTRRYWESKLSRVGVQLPPSAHKLVNTLKSTIAYILINQDGPAIQPGSRAYDRSWIRDGALTAAALLRMGHIKEVREFIEWYGKFQWANGKIPCCVDWRGRDPVPEHDSHGQWIYLVMEYYRFTGDVGFLTKMWPRIVKAVNYIVWLRQQRLTDEYKTPEKLVFYGLVPESVSHEGYMDAPVHSYWDGLFVLRGLKDAANGAVVLGEEKAAQRFGLLRDTFRQDLYTSMRRSMTLHKVNYIPGAAELGDFDSNATTIGLDPVGETSALPQPALRNTFDKYYEILSERISGNKDWRVYTPYELRAVGAFIRMGLKERAHEALDFFFQGQHPQAWNHWGEVVWRDPKVPKYIGDMPHTWVGSDYIRSIRSLFVYERESDHALVIGAGVLADWVRSDEGISLKRLPTYYGTINYSMRTVEEGVAVRLSGDVTMPSGKIVIRSPLGAPLVGVTVNSRATESYTSDEAIVDQFPAEVLLHYGNVTRTAEKSPDERLAEHCTSPC